MSTKLITDSASDLSEAERTRLGIGVVPLTVRFDDEAFIDGVELTTEAFWARANSSSVVPATAAPSPGAFAEAFRTAKAEGHDSVVCITLSAGLSGTFQAAKQGAAEIAGEIEVHVVDSKNVSVALAQILCQTAEQLKSGATAAEAAEYATALAERTHLIGVLDTLENLKKNGRIGAASAFFGALLAVKPIIRIVDGVVQPLGKQRTRSKALKHLAELVQNEGPISHLGVSHSGAPDVDEFIDLLAPVAKREDILVEMMGPTIGVHGGPRLIAVTFAKAQ